MSRERTFPNETSSVRKARQFALDALGAVAPPVADAIALMVSELTANAVRHTSSHFTVVADRTEAQIRISVSDDGAGSPEVRVPQPTDLSGRGLQIIQRLATEWGVIRSADGRGKTVWFTYALPARSGEASLGERSAARADLARTLETELTPDASGLAAQGDAGSGDVPVASRLCSATV